jgi:transcription antitermination factor NusG
MQNLSKKWYVVYTRPKCEKRVSELLSKKRIENYCPLNKKDTHWSDRKKVISEPLFSSYVFVHLSEEEKVHVYETEGVINFVHWLGKPAVIGTEEIEAIKRFLNDFDNVRLEKTHVNLNDHVRVISGPIMLREGNVMEVRYKTVKVCLPTLGHTLVAEVKKENIEGFSYLKDVKEIKEEIIK